MPRDEADVVDQDVDAAKGLDRRVDHRLHAVGRADVRRDRAARAGGAAVSAIATARVAASVSRARAQTMTRHPSAASACALAKPSPRLEPVTIATCLSVQVHRSWTEDR